MFYVVGAQQDLHFQQLFKILQLCEFSWHSQCHHINFGMVRGMSTRKGTVVFLEDILAQAKDVMLTVMQKNERKYEQIPVNDRDMIADNLGSFQLFSDTLHTAVAISAVYIQDMTARRTKDYDFDWDRMTNFEGDTGPYLQYAHVRLCSMERTYLSTITPSSTSRSIRDNASAFPSDLLSKHLQDPKALDLIFTLAQYTELIASLPERNFEPCQVVAYLMALSHRVSSCLENMWVMGQEREVAEARLWLYWSCRIVIGNGLRILGLRPLERM